MKTHTLKTCVTCGEKFDTTWETRRRITCSKACAYLLKGKQNKERGYNPSKTRNYAKWLTSVQSEENRRACRDGNLGKIRNTPKSRRFSPQHTRAAECFLRSPNNVVYYVRNITRFVHEKPQLFPLETLNWKPHKRWKTSVSCFATHGLATIARGHRMTWRGWQLVSNREGRERYDMIGRNKE